MTRWPQMWNSRQMEAQDDWGFPAALDTAVSPENSFQLDHDVGLIEHVYEGEDSAAHKSGGASKPRVTPLFPARADPSLGDCSLDAERETSFLDQTQFNSLLDNDSEDEEVDGAGKLARHVSRTAVEDSASDSYFTFYHDDQYLEDRSHASKCVNSFGVLDTSLEESVMAVDGSVERRIEGEQRSFDTKVVDRMFSKDLMNEDGFLSTVLEDKTKALPVEAAAIPSIHGSARSDLNDSTGQSCCSNMSVVKKLYESTSAKAIDRTLSDMAQLLMLLCTDPGPVEEADGLCSDSDTVSTALSSAPSQEIFKKSVFSYEELAQLFLEDTSTTHVDSRPFQISVRSRQKNCRRSLKVRENAEAFGLSSEDSGTLGAPISPPAKSAFKDVKHLDALEVKEEKIKKQLHKEELSCIGRRNVRFADV